MAKIEIHLDKIVAFSCQSDWVSKAQGWLSGIPNDQRLLCIDSEGYACNIGRDFQIAEDFDRYPVTAYLVCTVRDSVNDPYPRST